ncbi:mucin-3A-like [Hyalella azteca]|uniref:Mucin-3A-like n=1 Tax=Hyalella azteca TaxID=294128 RepID=A0A979FX66_HYAAZ|nr:mucin-3A-like [Hyalella azteca]
MCVRDESIASEKKYLEISTEKCNSSSISPLSVTFNSSNSFLSTPIETVPSQQDVGDSVSFPRNHDHEAIPTVLLITSNTKAITTSDVMTLSGPQASLQPQCSTSHDEPIIYFPVSKPQCSTSHNNEPINHSNTLESQCSTSRDEHIIYFPVSKPQCSTSHNNEPNNHSNALESQCSTSHDEHIKFSKASEPQCLTTYGQPVTYSTAGASVTNTLVYYSAAHQPQEQSTDHKHPAPKGSSLTDSSVFCSNGNSDFLLASSSNKNVNVEDKLSTTSLVGSYIETLEAIQPSIDCISNNPIKTSMALDASSARTELCSGLGMLARPTAMNTQVTNDKPHAQKSEAAVRPRLNSSQTRRRRSECEESVSGACTRHEVHSVTDRTVQSRAWESLPSSYLTIRKIGFTTSECYGVFCKRRLQLHTLFRPLQGIARDHAPDKSSGTADNTLILADINGFSIKDQQDNEQQYDTKQLIWPFTDSSNHLKFLDTSDLGKIKLYCIYFIYITHQTTYVNIIRSTSVQSTPASFSIRFLYKTVFLLRPFIFPKPSNLSYHPSTIAFSGPSSRTGRNTTLIIVLQTLDGASTPSITVSRCQTPARPIQAVAVRLQLHRLLTVCNIYVPPRYPLSIYDLVQLSRQLPPPYLIIGDFNARNPIWGDTNTNQHGDIVEQFLVEADLCLLNTGAKTRFCTQSGESSALDLSFCSPDIVLDLSCRKPPNTTAVTLSSNHLFCPSLTHTSKASPLNTTADFLPCTTTTLSSSSPSHNTPSSSALISLNNTISHPFLTIFSSTLFKRLLLCSLIDNLCTFHVTITLSITLSLPCLPPTTSSSPPRSPSSSSDPRAAFPSSPLFASPPLPSAPSSSSAQGAGEWTGVQSP